MDVANLMEGQPVNVPDESKAPPETTPRQAWNEKSLYLDASRRKSPALAAFLSVMPGLGQVYVGYYQQGFINILVVGSLIAVLSAGIGPLEPFCGIFLAFFWLFNVVDASRRAKLYNQSLLGMTSVDMPENPSIFEGEGSLVGGIILVALGALAFAHTKFNVNLDWLEEWWPLALVFIGAYLVVKVAAKKFSSA